MKSCTSQAYCADAISCINVCNQGSACETVFLSLEQSQGAGLGDRKGVWGALGFGLSALGALQVQQQSREWEGLFRQLPGQQPTAEASRGAEAQVFCALSGTVPEVNTCICDTSN